MKVLFLFLLLTLGGVTALAEDTFHNPDKVYLHLDRQLYAQGDTIWIKGYVMQRGSHKLSNNSYALHIQMLDEQGREVHNYKMLTIDGIAQGQIQISSVMAPGFYQIIAHTGYMKNFDQRFFYKTSIEVRKPVRHKTMSVLFDRVAYEVGDTARVTFTMFDKHKSPIAEDRFTTEYTQGDEKPKRKRLRCNDDGTVTYPFFIKAGSYAQMPKIKLSYLAKQGDEHPLTQEVYVPMFNEDILLEFFPEGGDLVQGVMSKVAFKACDIRGAYLDVAIDLYEDGEKIRSIPTIHEGMGMFTFTPKVATYTAKITSHQGIETVYTLPKVKTSGYTLSLVNQTDYVVNLLVNQNIDINARCRLWISHADSLLYVRSYTADTTSKIRIDKTQLPPGIVTFTISDDENIPQAERLVYINKKSPQLRLDMSQTVVDARQKVELSLALDTPVQAHLSFAVVDSFLATSPNLNTANMKAYTYLQSELKGPLHNPNQYIGDSPEISSKRDLLLLTHGWRHFECIANAKYFTQMKVHDFNRVLGQVTRFNRPYANAPIQSVLLGKSIAYSECVADEQGRFYFDISYEERTSQNILISSKSRRGSDRVTLRLTNTDTLLFGSVIKNNAHNLLPILHKNDFTLSNSTSTTVEQPFMMYESILLKEFEVSADKQTLGMSDYFEVAADVALGKDLEDASSFYWLISQFTYLIDDSPDYSANQIRTNRSVDESVPLDYSMDRIRITTRRSMGREDMIHLPGGGSLFQFETELRNVFDAYNPPAAMIYVNNEAWGYETGMLDFLKSSDIVSIAILDGIQGYKHFGSEAYYGAIIVETYDKNVIKDSNVPSNHEIFGRFIKVRQFSKQMYDTPDQSKAIGDDNRVTLHWEPLLEIDDSGKADLSFYTSDIPGKKQIIIQGLDDEGNLYYQTTSFMVKDILEK